MSKSNEERLRTAHHDVSIFSSNDGSDWDVWLEPRGGELAGVCIGGGATRDEAVQCAVDAIEAALATLQETPSPEATAAIVDAVAGNELGQGPILRTDKKSGAREAIWIEQFLREVSRRGSLNDILNRKPVETTDAIYILNAGWLLKT